MDEVWQRSGQLPLFAWCTFCGEAKPLDEAVRLRPSNLTMLCRDCQPVREKVLGAALVGVP